MKMERITHITLGPTPRIYLDCGHFIGDGCGNDLCCRLCEHGDGKTGSGSVSIRLGCGHEYEVEGGDKLDDTTCEECNNHDACHEECIYAPDHDCSDNCDSDHCGTDSCGCDNDDLACANCGTYLKVKALCRGCTLTEALKPAEV